MSDFVDLKQSPANHLLFIFGAVETWYLSDFDGTNRRLSMENPRKQYPRCTLLWPSAVQMRLTRDFRVFIIWLIQSKSVPSTIRHSTCQRKTTSNHSSTEHRLSPKWDGWYAEYSLFALTIIKFFLFAFCVWIVTLSLGDFPDFSFVSFCRGAHYRLHGTLTFSINRVQRTPYT